MAGDGPNPALSGKEMKCNRNPGGLRYLEQMTTRYSQIYPSNNCLSNGSSSSTTT